MRELSHSAAGPPPYEARNRLRLRRRKMQSRFGSTPQDVLGVVRPFVVDKMLDFARIKVGAKMLPEVGYCARFPQYAAGERTVTPRQ
jgi:hypothetical protein